MSFMDYFKKRETETATHSSRERLEARPGDIVHHEPIRIPYDFSQLMTLPGPVLMDRPAVDLSNVTEEALNEQVQSLTQQGKFQTAADIIADWAFWDMVGRYAQPPEVEVEKESPLELAKRSVYEDDDLLDVPESAEEDEEDQEPRQSMIDLMQVRLDEEFGEHGWHP